MGILIDFYEPIKVAYFNGSQAKLAETLKVLERYQEENNTLQEPPSFLELDHGGTIFIIIICKLLLYTFFPQSQKCQK